MISIGIEDFISNTVGLSVHHITWDILTAAESDEQVRKIIADALLCFECFAYGKVLDEWIAVKVILKILHDPFMENLYLFCIGLTVGAEFVCKFFGLRVPHRISAVVKIGFFRIVHKSVCGD